MYRFSLEQLFGAGASQTAASITIQKADLPGLTAAVNNTAESILVGLLLRLWQQLEGELTDELGEAITDELGEAITYDDRGGYDRLNIFQFKVFFQSNRIVYNLVLELRISAALEYGVSLKGDYF